MSVLRYSLRQLRRRPGFCAVVIAMLAIGIGATTAMFSMFYAILFQELAVHEPERLVNLGAPGPKIGVTSCSMAGDCEQIFSYPMFRDLEARQTSLAEIAGHYALFANLAYANQTQGSRALLVSGGYFAALGIKPRLGRLLGPQDDATVGEGTVAVISHEYWQAATGADPDVVGKTVVVNGRPLTIVGVAPDEFVGTTFGWNPSVYAPLSMRWAMETNTPRNDDNRLAYWVYVFGRLAPGVSKEQASAELNTLYSGIINEIEVPLNAAMAPEVMARFKARQITVQSGARGQSVVPSVAGQPIAMLLGFASVVLLIVCVNVANLMLARGAGRSGEMAVRSSIGATRAQLVRGLLVESAVLAALGGMLSIPVAVATLRSVVAIMPADVAEQVTLTANVPTAAFAAAASLVTVLLFGLLPALRASAVEPAGTMKGQSRSAVGGRGATRFGRSLATIQVTFSMILLVFAGLFAQSLANLSRADLGMNVESVVTFTISPRRNGYANAQATQLFDALERELRNQPGVTDVASSMVPLIAFSYWSNSVKIAGYEPGPSADSDASRNEVSPSFFRMLAIPLRAGRAFTDADSAGAPRVAIVNDAFVRKFRLGDDVIGRRLAVENGPPDVEIVGLVADTKYGSVRESVLPQIFYPRSQNENVGALSFYVRSSVSPDDLMRTARRVVAAADPNLPVTGLMTMDKVVAANLFTDRLVALLAGGFAALATLLAATGLYGVLAYGVAQRTRELGLRLALGATSAQLRSMVMRQVATIALIGMPAGLAIGVALAQLAKALLFGLAGYDPVVLSGAVAVLAAVVLAAGYLPARRASTVEPMAALRYE
jgi:predicted permease